METFFPYQESLTTVESSIAKNILASSSELHKFITDPPARRIHDTEAEDDDEEEYTNDYRDITLIKVKAKANKSFRKVVYDTNAYLCKNVGTSADFSILQDICEREIEALEAQISNSINVPLYLGLAGTFIGIITGLGGIAFNVKALFDASNMDPLSSLLYGIIIAMVASLIGLCLMVYNSAFNYKKAVSECDKNKNAYYDFLRRELMPTLSSSMAASLNALKNVLGEFIGKFGHNLDAYADSAELLNENIEKQHLLLVEINKMNQKDMAVQIAETFKSLKDSADSLGIFRTYQETLNGTIDKMDGAVQRIDSIIDSFNNFASALQIVVKNQSVASDLQSQFRTAIEKQ